MKKLLNIICGIILIFIFSSFLGNSFSPKRKIAFQITSELSKKFKDNYGLDFLGISEAAKNNKYSTIGLELRSNKILSKEEGRVLLLACANDALTSFNSKPLFRQYMDNYPFTHKNIIINIYAQPQKNGADVYYPDIAVFSFYGEKLRFKTNSPKNPYEYFTEERETYDEAVEALMH